MNEYTLQIPDSLKYAVLSELVVIRWENGKPVVLSTARQLSNLCEYIGDMYRYTFSYTSK